MRDQDPRRGRAPRSLRREVSGSRVRVARVREAEPADASAPPRRGKSTVAWTRSTSRRAAAVRESERGEEARITPSSGNVFRDIGFPPAEAEHLLIRSDLMTAIGSLIQERGLTQARAARLFGVTQPRVSDLVRGRIDLFSIDSLVEMLARAGVGVSVRLERRRGRGRASSATR